VPEAGTGEGTGDGVEAGAGVKDGASSLGGRAGAEDVAAAGEAATVLVKAGAAVGDGVAEAGVLDGVFEPGAATDSADARPAKRTRNRPAASAATPSAADRPVTRIVFVASPAVIP
jgi:hypothetical protein